MSNGVLEIREFEISDIENNLNKSSSKIEQASTNMTSNLSKINSVGLLTKSTNTIKKQLSTIMNNVNKTNQSISNTYENISFLENNLTAKAEEIEVPLDFVKNDSSNRISITSGSLNKEDGKSVNSNASLTKEELDFNKSLEYNDKLKNIVKEYEEINGSLDDYSIDKTTIDQLKNEEIKINSELDDEITNKVNLEEVEYHDVVIHDTDESSTIKKALIEQLNQDINKRHPEFNDSFEIDDINLEQLENEESKEVDYNDSYKKLKEVINDKLNNGNYELKNNNK